MKISTAMAGMMIKLTKKQNLKLEEIVYLRHVANTRTDRTEDAKFWREAYNIDYQKSIKKLYKDKYIYREKKEVTSGLREFYRLTEKGMKTLKENDHILYIADLNMETHIALADKIKKKNPSLDKYDIACQIMRHKLSGCQKDMNWRAYRNTLVALASIYDEKEDYESELPILFKVCKMDMSRLDQSTVNKFSCSLADGIVSRIDRALCKLRISDNEAYQIYADAGIPAGVGQFYGNNEIWDEINMRIREYCYVS